MAYIVFIIRRTIVGDSLPNSFKKTSIFYFEIVGERGILLFLYDKTEMENVQTAFIEQILQTMLTNTAGADLQRPVRFMMDRKGRTS